MFTATISIAVEDFALSHALGEALGREVEADRLAAYSRDWVMPCLWTGGGDFEAFDAALADDPTVKEAVIEGQYETEKCYQIHWAKEAKQLLDVVLDAQASMVRAETTNDTWRLAIRFGTRDQFDTFRDHLTNQRLC